MILPFLAFLVVGCGKTDTLDTGDTDTGDTHETGDTDTGDTHETGDTDTGVPLADCPAGPLSAEDAPCTCMDFPIHALPDDGSTCWCDDGFHCGFTGGWDDLVVDVELVLWGTYERQACGGTDLAAINVGAADVTVHFLDIALVLEDGTPFLDVPLGMEETLSPGETLLIDAGEQWCEDLVDMPCGEELSATANGTSLPDGTSRTWPVGGDYSPFFCPD